eukprot:3248283-Rhodomonas_salina.1
MRGRDVGYGATKGTLLAFRCAVLTQATGALLGTMLRSCYATSGTKTGDAATRSTAGISLPPQRPQRSQVQHHTPCQYRTLRSVRVGAWNHALCRYHALCQPSQPLPAYGTDIAYGAASFLY